MTLAAGTRLGPYEITGLLGAGGMGEVYKARDPRLDRDVAIKVLPREWATDRDRLRRFEQEARAASALAHPNIVVVHDTGGHDDIPYLVEELLEGESLRGRLRDGALPVRTAIDIAVQLASGLAAAHEKGIVHRDLKPENVFLTRAGHVKILDFGLAKLVEPPLAIVASGETTLADRSAPGVVVGTAAYMSPEQARGQAVDHRADIFALGCVLYEMLAGRRAFAGDTAADTITAILTRDPAPLGSLANRIPPALENIVRRSLEKRPGDRFSSAHDLALALRSIASVYGEAPVEPAPKSIVVLPFENLSPDPDSAFFADGLAEELMTDLSKVRSLRVISRTSAMLLKGSKKDVPTIARELNVRYVLEGSVRRAGNNLRISAQLIDAAADAHLWADRYNGTLDDVFAIQENVSHAIVDALKLQLTPEETKRLAEHPIPNALAFELYLRARQNILTWTEAGLENALKYLQNGLEMAGPNPVLFAGLAYVSVWYGNLGLKDADSCGKEAEGYLQKAFALDPDCSQAHFVLGLLRMPDNPRQGMRHMKRVLDANPNDFDASYALCCALGTLGLIERAIPLEQQTARIDPLNAAGHFHLGFNRLWEGKFVEARDVLETINRRFPGDPSVRFSYALSLAYLGNREQATAVFEELSRAQPASLFAVLGLSFTYAFQGRRAEARALLEAHPNVHRTRDFQYACWVAECYALIDDRETALDFLERDVDLGMVNYPFLNEYDPFLADVRGEPRFRQLMARVKIEWKRLGEETE